MGKIIRNGITYGGGGSDATAVKFIEQELTNGQQKQARENIGIKYVTQAEYNALGDKVNTDGILYMITDKEDIDLKYMTLAEYEALGDTVNNDEVFYVITDAENSAKDISFDNSFSGGMLQSTNVQGALEEYGGALYNTGLAFSYSTTEELYVGTWIDGKPIYRKVFTTGNLPNDGTLSIDVSSYNVGSVITLRGMASNGDYCSPIPYAVEDTSNTLNITYRQSTQKININTYSDRSKYSGYVIFEYTKAN